MNPATIPGFMPVDAPNAKARVMAGPMGEVCHTVFSQPAELPDPHIEVLCFGADNTPVWCDRLCVSILKVVDAAGNADFRFYWAEDHALWVMPPTSSLLFTIRTSDRQVHTKEIWVIRNTRFDWIRLSHPEVSPTHGVVQQLNFPSKENWFSAIGTLLTTAQLQQNNILQGLGVLDSEGNLLIGTNGRIVLSGHSYQVQVKGDSGSWNIIQEVDF